MAIDMRQFHQTFFEESLEGLSDMEAELLLLEKAAIDNTQSSGVADPEILNTIFRAAHSIKGGSSTFGFTEVAGFAHVLESRLDAMREGRSLPERHVIGLLLLSVDCLRSLIIAARTGGQVDNTGINAVRERLEELESGYVDASRAQPVVRASVTSASNHWHIVFRPHEHLFRTGNDPLRILRALADLGTLSSTVDASTLPAWEQMDPEACYLAWNADLAGPVTREAISEVFSWVADGSHLEILPKPTTVRSGCRLS